MVRVKLFMSTSRGSRRILISPKRWILDIRNVSQNYHQIHSNSIPFIDSRILDRSERSQISKVLKNIKYSSAPEELIGGLKYNIVGFSNEIRMNNGLSYVRENNDLHSKGEIPKLTSVAFCILYTIMYALKVNDDKSIKREQLEKLRRSRLLVNYKGKLMNITELKSDVIVEYNVKAYNNFIIDLISYYLYGSSQRQLNHGFEFHFDGKIITIEPEFIEILKDLLRTFERFNAYYGENKYELEDLKAWIKSISSVNIVDACSKLENRNLPPTPFLKDLLHRNVTSKYDMKLLSKIYLNGKNLFNQQEKRDTLFYLLEKSQQYSFKDCIPILQIYLESLKYFIRDDNGDGKNFNVISNFKSKPNNFESDSISAFTLNKLLWKLSLSYSKENIQYSQEMVKAQNFLISQASRLTNIDPENEIRSDIIPIKDNLNIIGKLGILNSQIIIDQAMVSQIFERFEIETLIPFVHKILSNEHDINAILTKNKISRNTVKSLLAKAYMVKLKLCQDKVELVDEFNEILRFPQKYSTSLPAPQDSLIEDGCLSKNSLVWSTFIIKLNKFKLLDSNRVVSVIRKIFNDDIELDFSSTQMINLLIRKCNDFQVITSFLKYMKKKKLLNSSIFQSTLIKLYSSIIKSDNTNQITNNIENKLSNFKNDTHKNLLSYARSLFNSFDRPNVSIIGVLLYYESFIQPEKIFDLYKTLLKDKSPDNNCLRALLNASSISKNNLVWGKYYAVQIALNEFNENTSRNSLDFKHVQPNELSWNIYIKTLHLNNYYDELNLIMPRWNNLRFIPSKRLLCYLLACLPEQEGDRVVKFGLDVSKNNELVDQKNRQEEMKLDVDICFEEVEEESDTNGYVINEGNIMTFKRENCYVSMDEEYSINNWPWPTQAELEFTRAKIKTQIHYNM